MKIKTYFNNLCASILQEEAKEEKEEEEEDEEGEEKDTPPKPDFKPPVTIPKEDNRTGANKFVYFVCSDPGALTRSACKLKYNLLKKIRPRRFLSPPFPLSGHIFPSSLYSTKL